MDEYSRLAINQFTTLQQWSLAQAIEGYARHGVHAIGVLRDKLLEIGATEARRQMRAQDMKATCYCIGGLLTDSDPARFRANLEATRQAIDEAAEIEADCMVFVAGGLPEGSKDLPAARSRCLEGLAELLPYAREAGVTVALEPLHPMICAFRSCLSTLGQANDWIDELGAGPSWASWSTSTMSGGTRTWRLRSSGPQGGSARFTSATGCWRRRTCAWTAA